jgi:epoxyqueuosine reductase
MSDLHGFARAVWLPAERLKDYKPNREAARQGILDDPRALLPGARSVLVAAMPFAWFSPWPRGYAEVSAFYFESQQSYRGIAAWAEALRAEGAAVDARQLLPTKMLGKLAGFGTMGRNTLLQNDAWGSCFTLRTLVTDREPDAAIDPMHARGCGNCRRCVEACPTGALDGKGNLNTERCLRAHMMNGEVTPPDLREPMGNRLLGCEICQRVCPRNARIPEVAPPCEAFRLDKLLNGHRADLDAVGEAIGWNEARLQRVQAQSALIAGNSGDPIYRDALQALRNHPRPAVSEHAAWALDRLL